MGALAAAHTVGQRQTSQPKGIKNGELIAAGVIVRNRTRIAGCEGCLRITVGTPAENRRMLETDKNFRP